MNRAKNVKTVWARANEFFCVDLTHQLLHKVFLPVSESIWWLLLPILDCCLYRWYWIYCCWIIINPILDQLVLNIDLKTLNSFSHTVTWVHEYCLLEVVLCFHHTPPLLRLQRQIQVKQAQPWVSMKSIVFWTIHGDCHTSMMVSFQQLAFKIYLDVSLSPNSKPASCGWDKWRRVWWLLIDEDCC
jgi:hypothetical protein